MAWLAFIPVDWVVAETTAARLAAATARGVSGLALLAMVGALRRRAAWLPRPVGRWAIRFVAALAASAFLVIAAVRPANFGNLQLSSVMLGAAVLLFTPIPLVDRGAIMAAFYAGFVVVAATRAELGVVDPALLALNLTVTMVCGVICGRHLERSSRGAYTLLCRSEDLNDRLAAEVESSEALRATLARQASEDGLTGLLNRRAFFDTAELVASSRRASGAESATMVIDVDRFKRINDTYGHAVGDHVLRELAHQLAGALRTGDLVGRLGGEEFCVLLPDTEVAMAVEMGDRLRRSVAARGYGTIDEPITVTVSVGVSRLHADETVDDSLHRADAAMYEAKRAGGDQVACELRGARSTVR